MNQVSQERHILVVPVVLIRRAGIPRRRFSRMVLAGSSYEYRLNLVPRDHNDPERGVVKVDVEALCATGWEFVSSRVSQEGDELSVFRHLVPPVDG
jgi:hypothetical protein